MKICVACNHGKPASEFYKDKAKPDGLKKKCKDCERDLKLETKRRKQVVQDFLAAKERRQMDRRIRAVEGMYNEKTVSF